MLGLRFRIPPEHGRLSLVSDLYRHVKVYTSGRSLVLRSPTLCVSFCMIRCTNNTPHLQRTSTEVKLTREKERKKKERKKEKEMLREFLFHSLFRFANSRLQATFGNSLLRNKLINLSGFRFRTSNNAVLRTYIHKQCQYIKFNFILTFATESV
jgi:hypothetical protein